jgi:hypothetical protein
MAYDVSDSIIEMCIRQVFRPTGSDMVYIEGKGDCVSCTPNEENKNCSAYVRIRFRVCDI